MVQRLPPSIKHLLTLRNPGTLPPPTIPTLHGVFRSTLADAKKKNVETAWLVLTTCTLVTVNSPASVGHLYRFASRSNPDDSQSRYSLSSAVNTAALMRESLLKGVLFIGIPRVILSMSGLMEVFEDDVKNNLRSESRRTATPENIESIKARGRGLWESIYEPHADKLHNKLHAYHPDFIAFIIQCYGALFAPLPDKHEQGNLNRHLGSVAAASCLRAEGGLGPQLTSHIFGLMKARYEEQQSAEDQWLSSDEGVEWVLRTVDSVLDVVKPDGSRVKL